MPQSRQNVGNLEQKIAENDMLIYRARKVQGHFKRLSVPGKFIPEVLLDCIHFDTSGRAPRCAKQPALSPTMRHKTPAPSPAPLPRSRLNTEDIDNAQEMDA